MGDYLGKAESARDFPRSAILGIFFAQFGKLSDSDDAFHRLINVRRRKLDADFQALVAGQFLVIIAVRLFCFGEAGKAPGLFFHAEL